MAWGQGRLLPTTSVDQFGAMAKWFGVDAGEMSVFPNITNFSGAYCQATWASGLTISSQTAAAMVLCRSSALRWQRLVAITQLSQPAQFSAHVAGHFGWGKDGAQAHVIAPPGRLLSQLLKASTQRQTTWIGLDVLQARCALHLGHRCLESSHMLPT